MARVELLQLREALEASWIPETAYLGAHKEGNPALGQCYPTSRVVQHFFPGSEIVKGKVWSGKEVETHFWNVFKHDDDLLHIDFTWLQFPHGSSVKEFTILDRNNLGDGQATVERCDTLRERVEAYLRENYQYGNG